MSMEEITFEKAKICAKQKGLVPGSVVGTNGVQFTKGDCKRVTPISWEEFEARLKERHLAVYFAGGWLKIMRDHSSYWDGRVKTSKKKSVAKAKEPATSVN